jgi:hypothetical protein
VFVDAAPSRGSWRGSLPCETATFVRATHGDHYDSMIDEGLRKGIAWLRGLEKP